MNLFTAQLSVFLSRIGTIFVLVRDYIARGRFDRVLSGWVIVEILVSYNHRGSTVTADSGIAIVLRFLC